MAVNIKKISLDKKSLIRKINRKLKGYEKLGFADAPIYRDFVLALYRTKGIKTVRRPDGSYYISQGNVTATAPKLNKLNTFQTVYSQIKKYGGKEGFRSHIEASNFIEEYINEIGYDVGVDLFDEFGKDLQKGLKNKYTRDELDAKIKELREQRESLTEVNPFG